MNIWHWVRQHWPVQYYAPCKLRKGGQVSILRVCVELGGCCFRCRPRGRARHDPVAVVVRDVLACSSSRACRRLKRGYHPTRDSPPRQRATRAPFVKRNLLLKASCRPGWRPTGDTLGSFICCLHRAMRIRQLESTRSYAQDDISEW
jgi:hypothetical protein